MPGYNGFSQTTFRWVYHSTVGDIIFYFLNDPKRAEGYYQKGFDMRGEVHDYASTCTFSFAHFHRLMGNLEKAQTIMKSYQANDLWYQLELGDLLVQSGKANEARPYFESIADRANPLFVKDDHGPDIIGGPGYLYQIVALQRLGRIAEMEKALANALTAPEIDSWRHFWLACAFAQIGQLEEAMQHLELAEKTGWEPNPAGWFYGTTKDFYLDPLRHLPAFQAWEQRWMPPYKDYSKN